MRRASRAAVRLAILLVIALVVSGCALLDRGSSYEVVAYFPRAVSLYEQGAVQVLGLPAGEISEIEVEGDRVRVTMAVDTDIALPADVKAAIVPQSLIGERRVQLFPPYQEGEPQAQDGHEIGLDDTVVPVEPDEALAALKKFLDSLDPEGVGRLIDNAATALDGQGQNLGSALDELSELVGNIEESDDDFIRIAERFDDFTTTLLTREAQLADVMDDFAVVADVLADERDSIEQLIRSLASISGDGLDLVSEHAVRLRTDVAILSRLTASVDANLDAITKQTEGTAKVIEGFLDAYNPDLRAIDLRNNFGPVAQETLSPIFDSVGLPTPCVPVDGTCAGDSLVPLDAGEDAVATQLARPTTPIDDVLDLLGAPTTEPSSSDPVNSGSSDEQGLWSSFVRTFLGVGR